MKTIFSNIFHHIDPVVNYDFKKLALIRALRWNGDEAPMENGPQGGMNVNWDHYAKVLEAKQAERKNSPTYSYVG